MGNDFSAFAGKPTVDWQDLVYKTGFATAHNLTISGGSQNATYSFGGGYFKQEGIQLAQDFTRYSAKATADVKVGKYLKFGESLLLSRTERQVQSEETLRIPEQVLQEMLLFFSPIQQQASITRPILLPVAVLLRTIVFGKMIPNVGYTKMMHNKILGSLYGELEPIKGLKYKASLGLDYNEATGMFYQDAG